VGRELSRLGTNVSPFGRAFSPSASLCHMAILDEICKALSSQHYRISGHAADEMLADDVEEPQVIHATLTGEIIEDYPNAFPCPACLILGRTPEGIALHAVWAFDPAACYTTLVTVYRPDPARWTVDLRRRVK
jgi:Domain of unknown function (DUF4258)